MTNKQTLELALNALKCLFGLPDKFTGEGGDVAVWRLGGSYRAQEAIKALEEALAKQEQGEPVAKYSDIVSDGGFDPRNRFDTTPQQRTWVGLTELQQEILVHRFRDDPAKLAMEIERELREKNT